jgi:hypothetical protein
LRIQSRSCTRHITAQTSQNARNPSSSAVRDITKCRPSTASSSPAMQPISVDRVIRRTSRISTVIVSVPNSAAMNRQPNGFIPKICSPPAIIHLPTSGCTVRLGVSLNTSRLPARIRRFASSLRGPSTNWRAYPYLSSENASLA